MSKASIDGRWAVETLDRPEPGENRLFVMNANYPSVETRIKETDEGMTVEVVTIDGKVIGQLWFDRADLTPTEELE